MWEGWYEPPYCHIHAHDVDNGPDALTRPRNGWLYTDEGIQMAYDALEPRGVLGIWSAYDDDQRYSQLKNAGFQPDSVVSASFKVLPFDAPSCVRREVQSKGAMTMPEVPTCQ